MSYDENDEAWAIYPTILIFAHEKELFSIIKDCAANDIATSLPSLVGNREKADALATRIAYRVIKKLRA